MASGLGGLAEGLIAGSQIGLALRKQEQSEQEQSELSKLREQQAKMQMSAEERAKSQEQRAQESHVKDLSLTDLRIGLEKSREERAVKGEERALRAEERAARSEDRQLKLAEKQVAQFDWQVAQAKRAERDQNVAAMAPIEYQRVATGGQFSPEFMEAAKGTRFDPVFMAKQEYKDSAKKAYEYTDELVNKMQSGEITLKDVNDPEYLTALDTLMKPDIEQGIGEKDPVTGKTVESKKLKSIFPYENKGIVFEVETTLSDGTKYTAPVTEGRSMDPNDPVKVVPIDKFINHIEGYTRMASAFNQPDLMNAVNQYTGRPGSEISSQEVTRRQYLREVGDIDKWELEQTNKIDPEGFMDPESKQKKIDDIKSRANKLRQKTDQRYGIQGQQSVGKRDAAVPVPVGNGESRIDASAWAAQDANKKAFIQEGIDYASEAGIENPFNAYSPDQLEKMYKEWSNQRDAENVASSIRSK